VDVHVGLRIRLRRQRLGLSQDALAKALGVSFQQVQKYEKGVNRVSASKLFDIAYALQAPVAWFFEDLPQTDAEPETAEDRALRLYLQTEPARRLARAVAPLGPAVAEGLIRLAEGIATERGHGADGRPPPQSSSARATKGG
jgi:transcriptional regulator with XRE-family HTH domain